MEQETGPKAAVHGVVERIKGNAKEVAGAVTTNTDLRDEGHAQQEKAADLREVAAREADASRAEATAHKAEQRAHQA